MSSIANNTNSMAAMGSVVLNVRTFQFISQLSDKYSFAMVRRIYVLLKAPGYLTRLLKMVEEKLSPSTSVTSNRKVVSLFRVLPSLGLSGLAAATQVVYIPLIPLEVTAGCHRPLLQGFGDVVQTD